MEDVLDVQELPYNLLKPVICVDEKPYQLPSETKITLPIRKDSSQKIDSKYMRVDSRSIFVCTEPFEGIYYVNVRIHRTAIDWSEKIKHWKTLVIRMLIQILWFWIT